MTDQAILDAPSGQITSATIAIDLPHDSTPTLETCVFVAYPRRPGWKPKGEAEDGIRAVRPVTWGKSKAVRNDSSAAHWKWNFMWIQGTEARHEGVTHWAKQDDDVMPPIGWATTLVSEGRRHKADVIAAVVPLKDGRGITSTGVRNIKNGHIRRLTMKEIFELPETFSIEDVQARGIKTSPESNDEDEILVVNLGLVVCHLTGDWPERFTGFHMQDAIIRDRSGKRHAVAMSEDWLFSEWCWRQGLKVVATRKTKLGHWNLPGAWEQTRWQRMVNRVRKWFGWPEKKNGKEYRNDHVWGTCQVDPGD